MKYLNKLNKTLMAIFFLLPLNGCMQTRNTITLEYSNDAVEKYFESFEEAETSYEIISKDLKEGELPILNNQTYDFDLMEEDKVIQMISVRFDDSTAPICEYQTVKIQRETNNIQGLSLHDNYDFEENIQIEVSSIDPYQCNRYLANIRLIDSSGNSAIYKNVLIEVVDETLENTLEFKWIETSAKYVDEATQPADTSTSPNDLNNFELSEQEQQMIEQAVGQIVLEELENSETGEIDIETIINSINNQIGVSDE